MKKMKLRMNKLLLLFALVPMVVTSVIVSLLLVSKSNEEVKSTTHNFMLGRIESTGAGFDAYFATAEQTVMTFTKAPIVVDYLKHPEDPELAKQAQAYTLDFFGTLEGWEGIYIADWNSKVLTHPAEPVIGRVMREGDSLEALRNSMLSSDGVYDTGIITSPASGELIISLYAPVYDGDKPIGYVGAGAYVLDTARVYADVSGLDLESAYVYFVDKDGIMVYHPDASKVGNPVENSVVKELVAQMNSGQHPNPECKEYKYKGTLKYAAYYVGTNEYYVAVLTADEDDVLAGCKDVTKNAIIIVAVLFVAFSVLAIVLSRIVAHPIRRISDAMLETSEGSLSADTNIDSKVFEIDHLIDSTKRLQTNLVSIIGNVKGTSNTVNSSSTSMAEMAALSADSCDQVSKAVDELAQGSMNIAESCTQLAGEVDTMSQCCDDIEDEVNNLSNASREIQKANDEAKAYMKTALAASEKSAEGANEIAEIILETSQNVREINQAVELILNISTQTNLLSLNASIEAARAGEAGRGFAVVADEIGSLAKQSSESANTIQDVVKRINEISDKSVKRSQEIKKIIAEQSDYITDTSKKFEVLSAQVENSVESIRVISGKVDALSGVKDSINSNVSDLSAISEESAASTEESNASINSIAQSVTDISHSSEELKALADELNQQVSFFH